MRRRRDASGLDDGYYLYRIRHRTQEQSIETRSLPRRRPSRQFYYAMILVLALYSHQRLPSSTHPSTGGLLPCVGAAETLQLQDTDYVDVSTQAAIIPIPDDHLMLDGSIMSSPHPSSNDNTIADPLNPAFYDFLRYVAANSESNYPATNSTWLGGLITVTNITQGHLLNGTVSSVVHIDYIARKCPANSSAAPDMCPTVPSTVRLADLKVFLPFTYQSPPTEAQLASRSRIRDSVFSFPSINDAFAAELAMYHFNTNQEMMKQSETNQNSLATAWPQMQRFLQQLQSQHCPDLRLTMEIFDTESSPVQATKIFTALLQQASLNATAAAGVSVNEPLAAGIVGATYSSVTNPLATLSSVNLVPQVSSRTSSNQFDVKALYPLFGRTAPSDVADAEAGAAFFHQVAKSTNVVILHVADLHGASLQRAFQDEAAKHDIITESIAFTFANADAETRKVIARDTIRAMLKLQYQHVYAIFYETDFLVMMEAAAELNAVGPDFLYVFPSMDVNNLDNLLISSNSTIRDVFRGAGFIQVQGGITDKTIYTDDYDFDDIVDQKKGEKASLLGSTAGRVGSVGFDRAWTKALQNETFVKYVQGRLPASLDGVPGFNRSANFDQKPGFVRPFFYDAVMSLAVAMCTAPGEFFFGKDVYKRFLQTDFDGASGSVRVNNITGSRIPETITFGVWNSQVAEVDKNGKLIIEFMPSMYYDLETAEWKTILDNRFVFANGSTKPPSPLSSNLVNNNYIGDLARIIGYSLVGIAGSFSLVYAGWVVWFRREHVVLSAQPLCLLMVCFGTIIASSAIIPLGMDETVASQNGLNMACMAVPWILVLGATIMYSPLLAKIRGVHRAYKMPELDFIHVSAGDVMFFFFILGTLNLVVMITWTFVGPLRWTRTYSVPPTIADPQIESYGTCYNGEVTGFLIAIGVVNIGALAIGNWWSYQSRHIETEYHESSFVGLSLAAITQALLMGIPLIIVVQGNPPARFYVQSGIIFVSTIAVLSFLFIPKLYFHFNERKEAKLKRKVEGSGTDKASDGDGAGQDSPSGTPEASLAVEDGKVEHKDGSNGTMATPDATRDGVEVDTGKLQKPANSSASERPNTNSRESLRPHGYRPNQAQSWSPDSISTLAADDGRRQRQGRFGGTSQSSTRSGDMSRSDPSNLSNHRTSRSFFGGAMSSKDVSPDIGGVKVIHNPRTQENLDFAGGIELSKLELEWFRRTVPDQNDVESRGRGDGNHHHSVAVSLLAGDVIVEDEEGEDADEEEEEENNGIDLDKRHEEKNHQ